VVVLVPGSNGDGRPMADDSFWREFATPGTPNTPNAWLLSERIAVAWKATVNKSHEP
jgi:hypothetical protein